MFCISSIKNLLISLSRCINLYGKDDNLNNMQEWRAFINLLLTIMGCYNIEIWFTLTKFCLILPRMRVTACLWLDYFIIYNIYLACVLIIVYVFLGEPLQKLEFFMMSFYLMFNTAICVTCPIIACDKQHILKILSATQSTNVIHQIHHTALLFHMPRPSKVLWCMQ